jgi:HEAT repeat protein
VFVRLLKDPKVQMRRWAASNLQNLRREARPALPALIRALSDEHKHVRGSAALAIGAVGPEAESAVPALIEALSKERDPSTQGNLAEALGEIGPASAPAVPELTTLLDSKLWATRRDAADAMGRIGPAAKSAIPKLTALLSDNDGNVRLAAAQALGLIGVRTEAAVEGLKQLFNDEDKRARGNAIQAVWRLTKRPELVMPAIVSNLKESNFWGLQVSQILETLIEVGPPGKDAESLLVKELAKEVSFHRNDSFLALWSVRGRPGDGVIPLLETLKDSTERADAIGALGWLGKGARNAIPGLRTLLQDENRDQRMRSAAAEALREIKAAQEKGKK